jgi:alpha-L-fucosidase
MKIAFLASLILCSSVLAQATNPMAKGGNSPGYDMAPETRPEVVEAALAAIPVKLPPGPFQPTWESLKANYRVPQWFNEAKFGIFMHWGLYAVPAYHNEWYEKHMYGDAATIQWHGEHFGPQDQFGYKDFIPMFTCEKFNPDAWAELFKKSGARYIFPTAEHHDNFALWDSAVTPINAKQMGPKRDLIGELARAVRARGIKFGVSNHGIENFQFINPTPELAADLKSKQADLYDPKWAEFYHVADRSDEACKKFLVDWVLRNVELIDKYQPDTLYWDNGVDQRYLDPLKLWLAAYYYNRAVEWKKPVTLTLKKAAMAPSNDNTQTIGSVMDFEKIGARSPSGIRPGTWEVDDPIASNSWGYVSNLHLVSTASIIQKLVDTVSKNGNYVLNISPKADGTIPQEQQDRLLGIGNWLEINGEAIYGTHNWTTFSEGGGRGNERKPLIRFTVKGDDLFAIIVGDWPGEEVTIASVTPQQGKVESVTLLGNPGALTFTAADDGLKVKLPAKPACDYAYALKITGLKTNPPTATDSGNPQ